MSVQTLLSERVSQILITVGVPADREPQVRQSTEVQFDDYQTNGMTVVTKRLSMAPRQLAEQTLSHPDFNGITNKVEIAEPGFINILLSPAFLTDNVNRTLQSERLGVTRPQAQTIVVDCSALNVAKEVHAGHLRSTVIDGASAHTLEFPDHRVIRANHVGDWGTQFGMLIAYLEKQQQENVSGITLADLRGFCREAKKYCGEDETFAERARSYVVKLQGGDQYFLWMWCKLVDITTPQNQITYDHLNVTLTHDDVMGESLYNPVPPRTVAGLKAKGLVVESEGTTAVFLDGYKDKEDGPMGVTIQKKDGGCLHTTTDIVCAKYRYETLYADRTLYYVDFRQCQHLMQAWIIARKAGYVPDSVLLEHHTLGMMLGKDGKPFKTRAGDTVRLADLLDEAPERTRRLVVEKNPNMSTDELENLTKVVGIGAVKYADLSKNRATDCIFDWDNMLVLEGSTTPYTQHAYTRVLSVFRKAGIDENVVIDVPVVIIEGREAQLAARLLQFGETLFVVAREETPYVMCAYLYDLTGPFPGFYEHCPTLSAGSEETRNSHLKLALLTAKTLKLGFDTLGIETVERM